MSPERGCDPEGQISGPRGKQQSESWKPKDSASDDSKQEHRHAIVFSMPLALAVGRVRSKLARAIATPDEVFSSDMSMVIDRLTAELERLRAQVGDGR